MRFRIFISSVQSEFASARRQLAAMIRKDRWLSMFFDVFLFEETDAQSKSVQQVYLDAVADSDIYLGIAQAMSWTSYVEKSGNGTREIVRKCIGHGLAEPVFEPRAGFFHVIIWRKGYGLKSVDDKGPSQKGSAKGPGQMLLVIRNHSEISISGIADAYGKKSASGSMKRCLLVLIDDGLVAPTRPQKRGSRLQAYRVTAKGIKSFQQR